MTLPSDAPPLIADGPSMTGAGSSLQGPPPNEYTGRLVVGFSKKDDGVARIGTEQRKGLVARTRVEGPLCDDALGLVILVLHDIEPAAVGPGVRRGYIEARGRRLIA